MILFLSLIPFTSSTVTNCLTYAGDGVSCIACNIQYHLDTPSTCGLCIDSWCQTCSQSMTLNACTQCIVGFYFPSGPTSGCSNCPMSNCNICNSSACIICNNGYVPAVGGASCNTCINFMTHCLTCTNSSVCTGC